MPIRDRDAGSKKVTLYYTAQTIPNSGYMTEHVHMRDMGLRELPTGKLVMMEARRKREHSYSHLGFGRHEGSRPSFWTRLGPIRARRCANAR